MPETSVGADTAGVRLDRFLAGREEVGTRARAERLIDGGGVLVDGIARPKSHRLAAGSVVAFPEPAPSEIDLEPADIDIDVVWEDEHLMIVDKPAGLVVHPAPGTTGPTLVHALLGRVGHPGSVQMGTEGALVHGLRVGALAQQGTRRLNHLVTAAVVERHPQRQPAVGRGALLHVGHQLEQVGGAAVAAADKAHLDALAVQVGELLPDRVGEQGHQVGDLLLGAPPVLGRKGVHGQAAHAQPGGGLDRAAQRGRARAVPGQGGQPAAASPAAVAIHDHGDRGGGVGQLGLDVRDAAKAEQARDPLGALTETGRHLGGIQDDSRWPGCTWPRPV